MEKTAMISSASHFQMSVRDVGFELIIYLMCPFGKMDLKYIQFTGEIQVGEAGVLARRRARRTSTNPTRTA